METAGAPRDRAARNTGLGLASSGLTDVLAQSSGTEVLSRGLSAGDRRARRGPRWRGMLTDRRGQAAGAGIAIAAVAVAAALVLAHGSGGRGSPIPPPEPLPVVVTSWGAVVHGAGADGLTLRSTPAVTGGTGLTRLPEGSAVRVQCGVNAASVFDDASPVGHTSTVWLRTEQNQFASSLYLYLAGKNTIVNCEPGLPELSLIPEVAPTAAPLRPPSLSRSVTDATTTSRAKPSTTTTTPVGSTTPPAVTTKPRFNDQVCRNGVCSDGSTSSDLFPDGLFPGGN